jgi:hypothetical protein
LSAVSAARIDSLKLNLSYGEIRLEKYKDSKELIVMPVLSGFKSGNNSGKNPANYLVLVFENQDSITGGNIIQYISLNSQKAAPKNTFYKIFTYQELDCSGQFTILSITDYFRYELEFEKGKLKSVTEQTKKAHPNNGSGKVATDCIDWYEQTWYYWADGTCELISEIYVFTTCDGECWQPRVVNGRSLRINCSGGGGGGGNDVEYQFAVSKPFIWRIYLEHNNLWEASSYERLDGIKKASESCGGHFTSYSHVTSYLDFGQGYTWTELANTQNINNPCEFQAWTNGKVTRSSTGQFNTYYGNMKAFFELFF